MLCYADDVAIFFHGINHLKSILKNLEEWTLNYELTINKDKSGIMFIRKKDNEEMRNSYRDGQLNGYPIVQFYKFLGISVAPNFDLSHHFTALK